MNERFDDIIRKQLEGLESPVPEDMFEKIRIQPDVSDVMFDAGLKSKLQSVESEVAAGLFDKLNDSADLPNASFDEAVVQKITGYTSQVPADMWERIMQDKQRRRPVAWWWVAAGLVLLLSGSTWYAVQQSGNKKEKANNDVILVKNNIPDNAPVVFENSSAIQKKRLPANTGPSQDTISANKNPYALKQENADKTLSSANKNATNPISTQANRKTVSAKYKQQESVTLFVKDSGYQNERDYLATKPNKKDVASKYNGDVILNSGENESHIQTKKAFATIYSIRLAIGSQLRNAAKLLPGQLLKAKPRLPVIPCPVNEDEGRNNWYVDIYTSAYMIRKNISDKTAGKNAREGFDSTLHLQLSYNAGINLVKKIGSHLLLKTGVQYNRLNELFRLTRINERKLITITTIRLVIIAPGDTVYIRDTSVTEHIGTIQRRKQNTYQQWDVPVIMGYEFGGENIHLNANAGIIANIRSAYSGEMLADTGHQIIDANKYNGKPVYKTNTGFSVYAGLSIVKPLGERTSLLIEPYARIGLQNTTNENAWFRQKNSSAGISVGLRYQLNSSGQRR